MSQQASPRILLVEDQALLARVVVALLAEEGFRVDTAENGSVAVSKLQACRYDLVITDLMMPVMDGVQLLGWIRQEAALDVPVVVLSTHTSADIDQRLQALGVLAILKKPLDMDNFGTTVAEYLEGNA